MAKARYYSSFDLTSSFYQLTLTEKSIEIKAFSTRTRHVEVMRVVMGLRNNTLGFITSVYDIFRDQSSGNMATYMDDSMIFDSSFSEIISFLRTVFEKLPEAKL
jgi:hypothetical protein